MNQLQHKQRHIMMHQTLDELLADFMLAQGGTVLDKPIKDLLTWSNKQTTQPDHPSQPGFNFVATKPEKEHLELDCVPYEVSYKPGVLQVNHCRNSILGKLDNNQAITGNRSSEDYKYALLGHIWVEVYFEGDDCVFDASDLSGDQPTLDLVADWISSVEAAIESIGYEVLRDARPGDE